LSKKSASKTLFLIGTGALKNGWGPVLAAINELEPTIGNDTDAANFWFSRIIQVWRLTAHVGRATDKDLMLQGIEKKAIPKFRRDAAKQGKDNRKLYYELKQAIANHIHRAMDSGEMALSPEFIRRAADDRWRGLTAYVTTNWDLLLDRAFGSRGDVHHLHGHVDNWKRMLLPSEAPEEPYRTKREEMQIASSQRQWEGISQAKRIVIYGLSLSPLDASLAHTIGMGLDNPAGSAVEEIYIMNCGPDEVRRVAKRVRMLCPREWPGTIYELDCCSKS